MNFLNLKFNNRIARDLNILEENVGHNMSKNCAKFFLLIKGQKQTTPKVALFNDDVVKSITIISLDDEYFILL